MIKNNNQPTNDIKGELVFADIDMNEIFLDEDNSKSNISLMKMLKLNNLLTLDINKYMNAYITIFMYFIISIISAIMFGEFSAIFGTVMAGYLVVLFNDKTNELDNTNFVQVAMSNLSNSINMVLKSGYLYKYKKDSCYLVETSTSVFLAMICLSASNTFRILLGISFFTLLLSYLISFSNKDLDLIKSSLFLISKYGYTSLLIGTFLFIFIFKSSAINLFGFSLLLICNYLNNLIINYDFRSI